MKQKYQEILVSFCLGISWVLSFWIATYLFLYGFQTSFFTAVVYGIAGLSIGLLFVAFFEGLSLLQDIAAEKKEQTKTLKDILAALSSDEKISDN